MINKKKIDKLFRRAKFMFVLEQMNSNMQFDNQIFGAPDFQEEGRGADEDPFAGFGNSEGSTVTCEVSLYYPAYPDDGGCPECYRADILMKKSESSRIGRGKAPGKGEIVFSDKGHGEKQD